MKMTGLFLVLTTVFAASSASAKSIYCDLVYEIGPASTVETNVNFKVDTANAKPCRGETFMHTIPNTPIKFRVGYNPACQHLADGLGSLELFVEGVRGGATSGDYYGTYEVGVRRQSASLHLTTYKQDVLHNVIAHCVVRN